MIKSFLSILILGLLLIVTGCNVKSDSGDEGIFINHTRIDSKWAVTSPASDIYLSGETITYRFKSSQILTVVGSPRIAITIGSATKYLTYSSGTGTDTLDFSYTVASPDEDHDGIQLVSPIDLNGGSISYPASVPASLAFTIPANTGINMDTLDPYITSSTITTAKTFTLGESIQFFIALSEEVDVVGASQIALDIDGNTKYATYLSGSGSNQLIYSYTVPASEQDVDGIEISSDTIQNLGSIKDIVGHDLNGKMDQVLPLPSTTSHFVDSLLPTILTVTLPANGTYLSAQNMDFVVHFSENISITNTPRFRITLNTGNVYANYLSGSGTDQITFRHIVAGGENDPDGIVGDTALDLNTTGTIRDAAGNNAVLSLTLSATTGILVDAIVPTVTLASPSTINLANVASYSLSGTCSENGLNVVVVIGSHSVTPAPICSSLAWSVASYDVSSVTDGASISITANHSDTSGNNALQASSSVLKDTVAPSVQTTASINGTYVETNVLNLNLTFNEVVTVVGSPQVPLTLDSGAEVYALNSGSGSNTLNFQYTVTTGDYDSNGVVVGPSISLNSGTIRDAAGNNALLALSTTSFPLTTISAPSNLIFANTSTYDFGQVPVGGNKEQTFLINYSGTAPATTVSGSFNNADFIFKGGSFPGTGGTCSATVNNNCTVVVVYTPSSAAMDASILTVTYSGGSITKNLTGEGVSLTPTKLLITTGPSAVIINTCVPFVVSSVTELNQQANVATAKTVTLVINNGTGTFYSDASCSTTTTTASIASGASSGNLYFRSTTAGQSLTLIFNTTGLTNTSHNVRTSNAPTVIVATSASEIQTGICGPVEVSMADGAGIKTGASTSKTINITHSSSALFYSDSFCTQAITSISYVAFEGTKNIYTKNAVEENPTFTFTDAGGILTTDTHAISFVDNLLWWDTDWSKRKRITLNNLDQAAAFTNIPILVRLNTSRIDYADFMAGGSDIRFTLDDHVTVLKYEVESWNATGESLIWVRIPSISASTQKDIFMYYNNPVATSDEDPSTLWSTYSGVWNMKKTGANYLDSTGSGKTAAPMGTVADHAGPNGNAVYFNGTSSIDTGYNLAQIIGRTSTFSFWMRTSQIGNNTNWQAPGITGVEQAGGGNDIFFGYILGDGRIAISSGDAGASASNFVVNDTTWRHVTMTRDEISGQVKFYINGVLNGTSTSETGYKSTPFQSFGVIGDTGGSPNYYNGYLDGVRLTSSIQTEDRVKAEYKFQVESNLSYGPEEDL